MLVRAFTATLAVITALVATTVAIPAAAQGSTEIAREKFTEGVAAYDAGQYEKARTLFLQAYALKRHPLVLLNLGQSELKSGHVEDAGNHLQQFLREHKNPTAQQKGDADAGIAEAQKKTGYVILIVDADGSELAIDGNGIGKSPLADPYFVSPGKHTATATKGGKTAKTEFVAKRGTATPVTLNLAAGGAAVPPVAPVPNPTPNPTAPPPAYPQPQPLQPYPAPMGPTPAPGFGAMPPPGGDTGREDLWPWFKRKPIAWALTGVAGGGLIATIVFGALAGNRNSNADDFSDQILTEVQAGEDGKANAKLPPQYWSNGDGTGTPQPCGTLDDPSTAFGHYTSACNDLRAEIDAYDDLLIGVAVAVPITVLSAAGLVAYYFIDTDKKDGNPGVTVIPAPIITADTQGGGIIGTF